MSILLLGGDGYLGWPLGVKLAKRYPDREILLVDNMTRRRLVAEVGSHSLLPTLPMKARIEAFEQAHKQQNLRFVDLDLASPGLNQLLLEYKPSLIYHLGQQASAGYSMRGIEEALFTVRNNELGNLRLLWGMRDHVPETHLIKLGSFGEYASSNIPIAEGFFFPEYKGHKAEVAMPYPRAADDIYHVTKINDTNFINMACRKWDLRITDIMQSTIFGTATRELQGHTALATRYNYDSYFGTVLNRFLVQLLAGVPLTIYGSGHQRTGLMGLEDSLDSLVALAERPAARGEHKVINHVTERRFSINELAEKVQHVAEAMGFSCEVQRGKYDPRDERPDAKAHYTIESDYIDENVQKTPLEDVIAATLEHLLPHRNDIRASLFAPNVQWNPNVTTNNAAPLDGQVEDGCQR